MTRLFAQACFLVASVALVHAQDCSWTDPDSGYKFDLQPAAKPSGSSYVFTADTNIYIANICGAVDATCEGEEGIPGVAFQFGDGKCVARLGKPEAPTFELLDPSNPNAGLKVTHTGGDICDPEGRKIERKVEYHITCDPSTAETTINGETEGQGEDICHYALSWKSPAACPIDEGSSVFHTLLVWGSVAFLCYLGLGAVYNVRYRGKSGRDAVPHIELWTSLFASAKAGATVAIAKVKALVGKEPANPYDSI